RTRDTPDGSPAAPPARRGHRPAPHYRAGESINNASGAAVRLRAGVIILGSRSAAASERVKAAADDFRHSLTSLLQEVFVVHLIPSRGKGVPVIHLYQIFPRESFLHRGHVLCRRPVGD